MSIKGKINLIFGKNTWDLPNKITFKNKAGKTFHLQKKPALGRINPRKVG